MKLRKLLAAGLALTLGLSLAAPALAAEGVDARLARVTLAVKETLGIGDDYTDFSGEPDETYLGTRWNLRWGNEKEELTVTAGGEGKVLSLYRWDKEEGVYTAGTYAPAFPAMSREEARTRAQAFLSRVLAENEAARFTGEEEESLSAADYSFRGEIDLNGLDSPMTFYVRVRLSDGTVTSFRREDVSDYAGTPDDPHTATTADKARALLKTTLDLRLEYVLDGDGKEEGGKKAVLRYLPNSTDDFYVDAATGELVNLTELRTLLSRQYASGAADKLASNLSTASVEMAADEGGASLTEAELAGVAKLEDVLDKEALDKAIRAWSQLGLTDYTLGLAAYSVDRETGEVTAWVTYAKNTEEGICRRYVTVDAKEGTLLSMSGSRPYSADAKPVLTAGEAQKKAEDFLARLWGGQFGKTALYTPVTDQEGVTVYNFMFAQQEGGYFYPANALRVGVDAMDGSIHSFSKNFDEDVTFDSAEGLISMEAAIDAWCGSYPVELAYLAVPVELNLSREFEPLRNAGYQYYNALKPGYALGEREVWTDGVDAKTGTLVVSAPEEARAMTYDDISGHWAQEALETLARYRVGWWDGKAEPDKALTQLDYVKLLASADGYTFYPQTGDIELLYDYAIRRGILTREEKDPDRELTRGEMVKMLLNSLGYRHVAGLSGIFRCDFADADAISEADLGYAALAQGLGLITGDAQGNYAPARPAVRSEAAVALWKAMQ